MQLNLARKWRSKQFSTIIGQDLVVKILKNGLFVQTFFPVYLFSGTRGCGKTTAARVFAAAINCEQLVLFQKDPSVQIPCGLCRSCLLTIAGKHPDFNEIDAASHTGVDNVREIIEAASLLPVIGSKKIYLIDEAHMLSKAAFNAFLKILEEPPATALFIFATTEPQKIIETVRSRCFQLFFQPISPGILVEHLRFICEEENISYELSGLTYIADEAQGSARDAINILERIRLSTDIISEQSVLSALNQINSAELIALFECIARREKKEVLARLKAANYERFAPLSLWKKCVDIIQGLIWLYYEVEKPLVALTYDKERFVRLAHQFSQERLLAMLEKLYQYEPIFLKTAAQMHMLEMLFIILCDLQPEDNVSGGRGAIISEQPVVKKKIPVINHPIQNKQDIPREKTQSIEKQPQVHSDAHTVSEPEGAGNDWQKFLQAIESRLDDPLISSIFKQAHFQGYNKDARTIDLMFAQKLSFFKGMLASTQEAWQPILHEIFGDAVTCQSHFSEETTQMKPIEFATSSQIVQKNADFGLPKEMNTKFKTTQLKQGEKARALLQFFPGTLSLAKDGYE